MYRFRKLILELLWVLAIIPSFCCFLGAATWNSRQTVSLDPLQTPTLFDELLAKLDTDQNGLIQLGFDHVFDGLIFGPPFLFLPAAICLARWWPKTDELDIKRPSTGTNRG